MKNADKVPKSLFLIFVGGITFLLEVVNMTDYIIGTRLALISYDRGVAAGLVFMSLTRCKYYKMVCIE